ncbi:septal ring lytic transglycosylase RlpA family protein [Rhodopseudomonas palustris]|uniref:Endolytic peptidoglycan transglycosylase RlpA n=1 Tax=Rhodopseudomonas palustris (strain BisB18) TaxID=316056 RepID=Q21CY3_RHOPB
MVALKTPALRITTGPKTAMAMIVASVFLGGAITEASAKARHHRHHSHHAGHSSWRAANASVAEGAGGRSFAGMASYYGNESGSRTASGQRMNASAMTAAHRSLPFGTKLRVTHGERSVIVTINDRGPFIRGRVLDLSTGAARAIGLTSRGVGRVVAEVM